MSFFLNFFLVYKTDPQSSLHWTITCVSLSVFYSVWICFWIGCRRERKPLPGKRRLLEERSRKDRERRESVETRNTLVPMLASKVSCDTLVWHLSIIDPWQPTAHVPRWDMEGCGILHRHGRQLLRPLSGLPTVVEEAASETDGCRQVSGGMFSAWDWASSHCTSRVLPDELWIS